VTQGSKWSAVISSKQRAIAGIRTSDSLIRVPEIFHFIINLIFCQEVCLCVCVRVCECVCVCVCVCEREREREWVSEREMPLFGGGGVVFWSRPVRNVFKKDNINLSLYKFRFLRIWILILYINLVYLYFFFYNLFNDTVSRSDFIVWNDRVINELWIWSDERSVGGIF
jgi:hypothetical protein